MLPRQNPSLDPRKRRKELIQKSKRRRKNMPRAAKVLKKSCILTRKERNLFTKTKKSKLKRPKPKINCSPP